MNEERERLIEIIDQACLTAKGVLGSMNGGLSAWIADKLIEAGVKPENRWIPVTERLPEADAFVLACVNGEYKTIKFLHAVMTAEYDDEGWSIEAFPEWRNLVVTHWMPLPESPEEV